MKISICNYLIIRFIFCFAVSPAKIHFAALSEQAQLNHLLQAHAANSRSSFTPRGKSVIFSLNADTPLQLILAGPNKTAIAEVWGQGVRQPPHFLQKHSGMSNALGSDPDSCLQKSASERRTGTLVRLRGGVDVGALFGILRDVIMRDRATTAAVDAVNHGEPDTAAESASSTEEDADSRAAVEAAAAASAVRDGALAQCYFSSPIRDPDVPRSPGASGIVISRAAPAVPAATRAEVPTRLQSHPPVYSLYLATH
jgi:hypothetical protein